MKPMSRIVLSVLVSAAVAGPAVAQNLAKERGNIVSANWQTMEVEIKDPKQRVGTWKVRRDATVEFTDKKSDFPNPKLTDLRPPMYVYFTFDADTKIVQNFEVREVGFEPSQGGPGVEQKGVITNLDANIGHVEVNMGAGAADLRGGPEGASSATSRSATGSRSSSRRARGTARSSPRSRSSRFSVEVPGRGGAHPGQGLAHRERPHRQAVARLQDARPLRARPRRPAPRARGGKGPASRSR